MDQRGVLVERIQLAEDGRKDLVLDVDQVDGPAGDIQAFRRHGGDRLAEVPYGILGQDVLVHDVQADAVVELFAGEDRVDAREVLGLGSVDRHDLRPGVWAPFHLGVEHAGKYQVARVHGAARQLRGVVDPLDVVAHVGGHR
jgi:hypothetical protein